MATKLKARSSKAAAAPVWSTPFVGRAVVLEKLERHERPAVMLFGEPGSGKTRTLAEVRTRLKRASCHVIRCHEGSKEIPLEPLVALIQLVHQQGQLSRARKNSVLYSPDVDRVWHLRSALEAAVAECATIIQIDDLQWANKRTLDAVEYLVDRLQDLPVTWHLTARIGFEFPYRFSASLEHAGLLTPLTLSGFSLDELQEYVRVSHPTEQHDGNTIEHLRAQTDGNPLYVQLVLAHRKGATDVSPPLNRVLEQRIQQLSSIAATVASWSAVGYVEMLEQDIISMTGMPPGLVRDALLELIESGIFVRRNDRYCFRHDLIRDASYRALSDDVRRSYHSTFAARSADSWVKHLHLVGAGRPEEAAAVLNRIGIERLESHEPTVAMAGFTRGLLFAHPDTTNYWLLRAGKAAAAAALGDCREGDREIREFEHEATVSDEARVAAVTQYLSAVCEYAGWPQINIDLLRRTLNEARVLKSPELPVLLRVLGATCFEFDPESAVKHFEEAQSLIDSQASLRETIQLGRWTAVTLALTGRMEEAVRLATRAAVEAQNNGYIDEYAGCCMTLTSISYANNDPAQREYWCRRGLSDEYPKSRRVETFLLQHLASVLLRRGEILASLGAAIKSSEAGFGHADKSLVCATLGMQAQRHAIVGDFEASDRTIAAARRIADAHNLSNLARQAIFHAQGIVEELRGNLNSALDLFVKSTHGEHGSGLQDAQSIATLVRAACLVGRKDLAKAAIDRLQQERIVPMNSFAADMAHGYFELCFGKSDRARKLLDQAGRAEGPFWVAYHKLWVSEITSDAELIVSVFEDFERLGAFKMAVRARSLARRLGLRLHREAGSRSDGLTDREYSVATLIAAGNTNAETASALNLSPKTVESHVTAILRKCNLRSRVDIAARVVAGNLTASHR